MSSKPWFDYFIMNWRVSDDKSPVESIKFLTAVFLRNFMTFHDSLYNIDTEFTRWLVGLVTKKAVTKYAIEGKRAKLCLALKRFAWMVFSLSISPVLRGFFPSSLVFIFLKNHGSGDSPKLEISLKIVESSPLKSLKVFAGNFWNFSLEIFENFHLKF